jgi:hypothetical protein
MFSRTWMVPWGGVEGGRDWPGIQSSAFCPWAGKVRKDRQTDGQGKLL